MAHIHVMCTARVDDGSLVFRLAPIIPHIRSALQCKQTSSLASARGSGYLGSYSSMTHVDAYCCYFGFITSVAVLSNALPNRQQNFATGTSTCSQSLCRARSPDPGLSQSRRFRRSKLRLCVPRCLGGSRGFFSGPSS